MGLFKNLFETKETEALYECIEKEKLYYIPYYYRELSHFPKSFVRLLNENKTLKVVNILPNINLGVCYGFYIHTKKMDQPMRKHELEYEPSRIDNSLIKDVMYLVEDGIKNINYRIEPEKDLVVYRVGSNIDRDGFFIFKNI